MNQVLNNLISLEADISIGYDSKWKDRYSGRNQDILSDAEKITLTSDQKIRIDKKTSVDENIIGEFYRFV